jgi:L-threonylcarbamoyladenylate synthase
MNRGPLGYEVKMRGAMAGAFERTISDGGVVLFPSDTVYGLACDPSDRSAIEHLYALKGRAPDKAAAVMFFDLQAALDALPELGPRTQAVLRTLLPGPVTVLVANPERRFALACGADPYTLGIRVVAVPELMGVHTAVMQSSANLAGGADPARLEDVETTIRAGADLVVEGPDLPGAPSTVLDLRSYEETGAWKVVRQGPISEAVITAALATPFHFDPASYGDDVVHVVHDYEEFQSVLVAHVAAIGPRRVLELGVGTGETTRRLLAVVSDLSVLGIDGSPAMLAAATAALAGVGNFTGHVAMLQEPLPAGEFDAVASALTVHHLERAEKADRFGRIRQSLRPGGRFVLADVVTVESDAGGARIELTEHFDKPSSAVEMLAWMGEAGFSEATVVWSRGDLAVIVATA